MKTKIVTNRMSQLKQDMSMIKMCGGKLTRKPTDFLCLDIIYLYTCLRHNRWSPDGLFPLIACNCQNPLCLCDLLTILWRAQYYMSERYLQKPEGRENKFWEAYWCHFIFQKHHLKNWWTWGDAKTTYLDTNIQWFHINSTQTYDMQNKLYTDSPLVSMWRQWLSGITQCIRNDMHVFDNWDHDEGFSPGWVAVCR